MQIIKKWEVKQRLKEIERRLYWGGSVGRKDLMARFGISPQQASTDLKNYINLADEMVEFQSSTKRYIPTPKFKPTLIDTSLDAYSSWVETTEHAISSVPVPLRSASKDVLRDISRAIHQKASVEITYRSLSNSKGAERRISPHSIVNSGARHHVRAYCHKRKDFRDFVLGRILTTKNLEKQEKNKNEDLKWNTLVVVRIGAHPGLTSSQREVIESDFSMVNGEAQFRIRQALLFYFLDQFSLDGNESKLSSVGQQIVLLNPEIISLTKA